MMLTLPDFLQRDEMGGIRLTGHRIGLHHFLYHYNQGYTAEMLLGQFPTLSLALIHKTIGFYLENQQEMDVHLAAETALLEQQRATGAKVDKDALADRFRQLQASPANVLRAG
ncbi:MAG: DUF433 domain-containing protein [Gemmatales bacterium]